MILATGTRSTIMQALAELLPHEPIVRAEKRTATVWDLSEVPANARVVIATGYMAGKPAKDLTDAEAALTRILNAEEPMLLAMQALTELPAARVCIVGSWSAITGSYDTAYAAWKRSIHGWVAKRAGRVLEAQQLCVVAPPIIADSGMTRRRADYPGVLEARPHCFAIDVAIAIKGALFDHPPAATREAPIIVMPATAGPEPRTCPC